MSPPSTQAPGASPAPPTRCATTLGVAKMPDPIMPPITAIVPEKRPRRRAYVVTADKLSHIAGGRTPEGTRVGPGRQLAADDDGHQPGDGKPHPLHAVRRASAVGDPANRTGPRGAPRPQHPAPLPLAEFHDVYHDAHLVPRHRLALFLSVPSS